MVDFDSHFAGTTQKKKVNLCKISHKILKGLGDPIYDSQIQQQYLMFTNKPKRKGLNFQMSFYVSFRNKIFLRTYIQFAK